MPDEPDDAEAKPRYHHGDLRAALLLAAEAELEEKGLERFSLRGVAKRAGVSHAAPAHHFRDTGGLLTALAAEGFTRFLAAQKARQAAAQGAREKLVASGLAYVDFAREHPAFFRLMFSSDRPEQADPALCAAAGAAYRHLVEDVGRARAAAGRDGPAEVDVHAAWAIAHGLADLMNAGRLAEVETLPAPERTAMLRAIIERLVL